MPADIVGSMIMETEERGGKTLRFQHGPIFAHLVLADEINRATPKTQSALLEAMQERTVTSGTATHELEAPFLVMATQNPIEMEGTYPLPEAQLDRFLMKILVTYPSREELNRIVERHIAREEEIPVPVMDRDAILQVRSVCREVLVAPHVQEYAIRLVMATQSDQKEAHELAKTVGIDFNPQPEMREVISNARQGGAVPILAHPARAEPGFHPPNEQTLDAMFQALADPTRRRMVERLSRGSRPYTPPDGPGCRTRRRLRHARREPDPCPWPLFRAELEPWRGYQTRNNKLPHPKTGARWTFLRADLWPS